MEEARRISDDVALLRMVRAVRMRWRLKRALVGAAITLAVSYVVYAGAAWAIYSANYSDQSLLLGRLACIASFAALAAYFIVRPLRPTVPDARTALYVEEHEPSLEGTLFTAVEVETAARAGIVPRSPALSKRLMDSAVKRIRAIGEGRRVDADE